MKVYTRTGDDGSTGLFGGERVAKTDPRVEAYGTVDELNAVLGVARAAEPAGPRDALLGELQAQLFALGANMATKPGHLQRLTVEPPGASAVDWLEQQIDAHAAPLAPLTQFILPAGSPQAAALHQARTVCRRAERCALAASQLIVSDDETWKQRQQLALVYLNRLSDLLFVLARHANLTAQQAETPWLPRRTNAPSR